jgi:N6-adenosine-specific RNA methylase IME4
MLYAVKGAGLKRADRSVRQAILAPRMRHSEKPDAVMLALEKLFGPVRRLELFARRHRPGWTCWGNQLPDAPTVPNADRVFAMRRGVSADLLIPAKGDADAA